MSKDHDLDEKTTAVLRDHFRAELWNELNRPSIDITTLKTMGRRLAADSPLRELLLSLPDLVSRVDMLGLAYPIVTLARLEDRRLRER